VAADDDGAPRGIGGQLKDALIGAHDHLAEAIDARKRAHVENVLEAFEADLAPHLAPIIEQVLANPAFPDHMRSLVEQAGSPDHQFSSVVIGVAIGAILGPVLGAATAPFTQGLENEAWRTSPSRPIPLDVAVSGVLKNVLGPNDPADEALQAGINASRFGQMVETAGNSMGLGEAITLLRRAQLAGVTLDEVLQYSNTNPKFYDAIRMLVEVWPSTAEVLVGWTKGHLSDEQAIGLYLAQGNRLEDYEWQRDSVGRPPGPMEVLDLWNRTDIDETQVDDALKSSDLAPRFVPWVKQLRVYYPPVRSILPMLRAEAITPDQAGRYWDAQGVPAELQAIFLKEAAHHTSSTVKQLTQAQIVSSYETRLMDRPTALLRLEALTYSGEDATALLDLADEKRTTALMNATVNMVGRRYVAYKLSKPDAAHALSTATVPNAAQLDLFRLWDIERAANVHVLTPASIIGAFRRGEIGAAECKRRLLEGGIAPDDLAIMVADGWPPGKPGAAQAAAAQVVNA
jgi:hypothetical protein